MFETKEILSPRRFSRYYNVLEPFFAQAEVQAYTMLILSVLAIAFFGFFAIRPTLTTIVSLRRQIADDQVVSQKLQEKINALSQVKITYDALAPDLVFIDAALPYEPNFPPFIKDLEKTATASGVNIGSLGFQSIDYSTDEASVSGQAIPVRFSLSASGDYTNLASYIKNINSFERLITINGLGFMYNDQNNILQLTLLGQTYYDH